MRKPPLHVSVFTQTPSDWMDVNVKLNGQDVSRDGWVEVDVLGCWGRRYVKVNGQPTLDEDQCPVIEKVHGAFELFYSEQGETPVFNQIMRDLPFQEREGSTFAYKPEGTFDPEPGDKFIINGKEHTMGPWISESSPVAEEVFERLWPTSWPTPMRKSPPCQSFAYGGSVSGRWSSRDVTATQQSEMENFCRNVRDHMKRSLFEEAYTLVDQIPDAVIFAYYYPATSPRRAARTLLVIALSNFVAKSIDDVRRIDEVNKRVPQVRIDVRNIASMDFATIERSIMAQFGRQQGKRFEYDRSLHSIPLDRAKLAAEHWMMANTPSIDDVLHIGQYVFQFVQTDGKLVPILAPNTGRSRARSV